MRRSIVASIVTSIVLTATAARAASGSAHDPSRIVSIGGAITEILYALGLERRIVAIDSTSLYPPQALHEKPNVGYMRQLSAEGVLGLNPSLIIATEGAGPKETIAVLQAAAVPFVTVPEQFTGEAIADKTRAVAKAAGAPQRGACLADRVGADLAALKELRARIERPLRVVFLLAFVGNKVHVGGRNSAADGIIGLAGGTNAITDFESYKPVNDEAIIAAKPDVVLAMQRHAQPLDAATVFAHPAFALTPAAKTKSFVAMDGLSLLGFGPRTARAARDIAATMYPALAGGHLPSDDGALDQACRG
jgi:iron complex transport system substrate-binding protein